jgi:flagellar protein FlaG
MRIEQPGTATQIGTAAPGIPAAMQSREMEGAKTATGSAPMPAPESAVPMKAVRAPVQPAKRVMEFTIDPDSGKQVVKIMDSASHELVRQIPMEEALALAKSLDQLKGLLLYTKV